MNSSLLIAPHVPEEDSAIHAHLPSKTRTRLWRLRFCCFRARLPRQPPRLDLCVRRHCHHICRCSVDNVLRMIQASRSSFFSGPVDGGDGPVDPLVDVVRCDPVAAARFIRVVMWFGSIGSVAVCLGCFIFWRNAVGRCGGCARPLRWWVLLHCVLQLSQVPVRVVFIIRMSVAERTAACVEACVQSLTASPAWRFNRVVSYATYVWFILGIGFVLKFSECRSCPSVYHIIAAVIFQALARVFVALVSFRYYFAPRPPGQLGAPDDTLPPGFEAAPAEVIRDLPLVDAAQTLGLMGDSSEGTCAVCLAEYGHGDILRHLPCGHYFHQYCADQWLARNKKCPLCLGAVDEPRRRR